MIARNFFIVCTVAAVFAVLFSNLVNNQHKYGMVIRLDQNLRLR